MNKVYLRFARLPALIILIAISIKSHAQEQRQPAKPEIGYHLSWDGRSSALKVRLIYSPATKDSTVFIYGTDGFGGQHNTFKWVSNVKCDVSDKLKIDAKNRKVTVYHTNTGLRELDYQIDGHLVPDTARALYNQLFRPVIADGNLYLVAFFFMMNPVMHPATQISIQWDNAPANFGYFNSMAPDAVPATKVMVDTGKRDDPVLIMGRDISVAKYAVHGIPYYAITSKDTVNNIKQELDPFFTKFFPALRDFWKDDDAAYYFVSLLPILESARPAGGGFSWGPGFIMKYAGKFDDWKKEVIAHETSHTWIGRYLTIGNSSFDNQWFGEGFNDYVCVLNLIKSGIFDKDAFVKFVNGTVLQPHYTSPVKNAPNDSIGKKYWLDKNYEKLPYRRGLIYAFYLDNQIQLASGGKQSIRDLLLGLFKVAKAEKAINPDATLTVKDFIDQASLFLPRAQIQQEVDNYMLKGDPIDLDKVKLTPYFKIEVQKGIPVLSVTGNIDLKGFCKW